ncbi:R8 protein [Exophiala xenobiotica]|nr:R8 protein [Exophiala xenobiotica]KAK5229511.1 R8 protein [Exophiala xenobiotica]KAK5271299.1 R8 protein [Exophiala xenobiotica]KAK5289577.1 R8 protein [Exophiala xenobiotica]KAK5342534.1 R8 protein [Exophiala xenobiotica]
MLIIASLVLTSRQYGVATIWLVATLGSKSNLKKVTRRAILDVDLPKACQTITEPELPMALRLQGSLLFGVTRVFSQQCGYFLTDITSLRDKMRGTEHIFKEMEVDPEVSKARPEQLNIQEDPFFLPELHLNFDLAAFGFPSDDSTVSSAHSPRSLPSSQSSLQIGDEEEPEQEAGLDIPSYSTPGGSGGFEGGSGATSSAVQSGSKAAQHSSVFGEEPLVLDEPVFDLGDDGHLHPAVSADLHGANLADQGLQDVFGEDVTGSDAPEAGTAAEDAQVQQNMPFDDDIMPFGEDEPPLPTSEAPVTPQPAGTEVRQSERATSSARPSEDRSETIEAPQRRARQAKALQPDQRTELSNRELSEWNQNYLANMAVALKAKQNHASHFESKKNAEFWVLRQGLGNVEANFGEDRTPHPLATFSGHSLWDLLRGLSTGTKRTRSSSPVDGEEDEEARRVRARTTSDEGVARGQAGENSMFDNDDGLMLQDDDLNLESEVGRHAPPSLPDHSSGMPWNVSASRHSSAQPLGSGPVARLSSSIGGVPGGMELGPPSSLGRRGSRFTSASPLLGRGLSLSRIGSQEPSHLTSNEDEFADLDAQLGLDTNPDFELYGPAANVDTQTAAQSQWVASALENEANDFLNFVQTRIAEDADDGQGDDEGMIESNTITFDELLPPTQNSQIVGAQGLLHVLALATKGLLEVHQAEPFGAIEIAVVSH